MNKLTRSEIGKMGANALNSDTIKKRAASIKGVETRRKKNPNIFREMAILRNNKYKKEKEVNNLIKGA